MTDIEIPSENERRAAQLIDFHGRLTDAASGRSVGAWRRVLTSLGCLHAISHTRYFPDIAGAIPHRLWHGILLADEPIYLLRSGGYPMVVSFLRAQMIGEHQRKVSASFGTASALLDLGADFIEQDDIHRFLYEHRSSRRHSGTRVERWIARFLDDGGSRGFLRFLDFSRDLAQLRGSVPSGEEAMGNLITATFAAPYADPHLEARLALAAQRLRHADPEWLQDRLEAVILLRDIAARSQPAVADIDAVISRARAAQFDRRVAVRTGLSARKATPAEAEELLSAS